MKIMRAFHFREIASIDKKSSASKFPFSSFLLIPVAICQVYPSTYALPNRKSFVIFKNYIISQLLCPSDGKEVELVVQFNDFSRGERADLGPFHHP